MKANDHIKQLCLKYFLFLEKDYNFTLDTNMTKSFANVICYKSESVGIMLKFEPREYYLFVSLCRLIDGGFPSKPGEMSPTTVLNCFDLDDVVALRAKNALIPDYATKSKNENISLEELIKKQAENLQHYANDIIQADFSIFTELDKIVKKRARQFAIRKWGERAAEFGWPLTEEIDVHR